MRSLFQQLGLTGKLTREKLKQRMQLMAFWREEFNLNSSGFRQYLNTIASSKYLTLCFLSFHKRGNYVQP